MSSEYNSQAKGFCHVLVLSRFHSHTKKSALFSRSTAKSHQLSPASPSEYFCYILDSWTPVEVITKKSTTAWRVKCKLFKNHQPLDTLPRGISISQNTNWFCQMRSLLSKPQLVVWPSLCGVCLCWAAVFSASREKTPQTNTSALRTWPGDWGGAGRTEEGGWSHGPEGAPPTGGASRAPGRTWRPWWNSVSGLLSQD